MRKTTLDIFLLAGLIVIQALTIFAQDDVTGYWKTGSVGSLQYRNQVSGATKSNRGSLFSYKFMANGSYEFIGYMESTMYNCTTTLFNDITGKYTVDGSTINLNPARDFWKSTNSCAASGNKTRTKTPTQKSLEFSHKTDEYGKLFLCLNDAGAETCFRKEKE
jgi:hypothetical protein